ncbi:polysulfide reductase NrfD (plasmid) [Natrinema halophilum]|nr:NrfD/PsrC family molybdoenzyme membrane anchor subunit [Natrinema halophilum]UHQ96278.1 polysulfide reductase NrfD [Natrinema halophilum]
MRCNHCDDSPCTDVCPVTALWEREDGIVDFDPDRCIGCVACMQGCPYDALYIDPETSTAAKCNYCSHRVDAGREPACVTVCPEDAIISGDMEDNDTEITATMSRQEVQARKPEKGTEPKLFYVDGDEGSTTPGTSGREDHYMWSDAPHNTEVEGGEREDFDLQRAAESLAESDIRFSGDEDEARAAVESAARSDGGCACGGNCGCQSERDSQVASDGGVPSSSTANGTRTTEGPEKSRTERAYELIHEEVTRVYDIGENHYKSWGWEVYSYTWTKSISAGVFMIPALLMIAGFIDPNATLVGVSAVMSTVFLGLTGVLLILDLEQPKRFHWVLLRPNWTSWLVKGAYIITAFGGYLALVLLGWFLGLESLVTNPAILAVGAVLAASTAIYTAFLFSQSKGRDLWQSPAMPLHMFTQAIIAGSATTAMLGIAGYDGLVDPSRLLLGAGLILHLALVTSEIFTPHQTEDAEEAAARITRGEFARAFWIGGMAVGIAAPLVILAASGSVAAIVSAGLLALAGLFAFEYCWITAPQTISLA